MLGIGCSLKDSHSIAACFGSGKVVRLFVDANKVFLSILTTVVVKRNTTICRSDLPGSPLCFQMVGGSENFQEKNIIYLQV